MKKANENVGIQQTISMRFPIKLSTKLATFCFSALLCFAAGIPTSYARDKNPPEVEALIGMKIPSEKQGSFGKIPGWKSKTWTALSIFPQPQQDISVEELYRDDEFIFVIKLFDKKDWSTTILDAQILPLRLLEYQIKNGGIVWKKNSQGYNFESMCQNTRLETVVGLMRPEPGKENCTHKSKQVKRAWQIDKKIGRITEIPPQGVSCHWETEDFCE